MCIFCLGQGSLSYSVLLSFGVALTQTFNYTHILYTNAQTVSDIDASSVTTSLSVVNKTRSQLRYYSIIPTNLIIYKMKSGVFICILHCTIHRPLLTSTDMFNLCSFLCISTSVLLISLFYYVNACLISTTFSTSSQCEL